MHSRGHAKLLGHAMLEPPCDWFPSAQYQFCYFDAAREVNICWERGWTKTGNPKYTILNSQSSPRRG
eukprot:1727400-Prymnesium_polylepis.1